MHFSVLKVHSILLDKSQVKEEVIILFIFVLCASFRMIHSEVSKKSDQKAILSDFLRNHLIFIVENWKICSDGNFVSHIKRYLLA